MKISAENYFEVIGTINMQQLPDGLKAGHDMVVKVTQSGKSWDMYHRNANIKRVVHTYFTKLEEYLESEKPKAKSTKVSVPKELVRQPQDERIDKSRPQKSSRKPSVSKAERPVKEGKTTYVAHLAEDVKFIKRFVGLHGKKKTPNALLNFIKALQKAISQKLISKASSRYVKEIEYIQVKLIEHYHANAKRKIIPIEIDEKLLTKMVAIAGGEQVYQSIGYLKRFIGMSGKLLDRQKTEAFIGQMQKAITSGKIHKDDPFLNKVKDHIKTLKAHLTQKKKTLTVAQTELNGLMGIIEGCGCKGLDGLEDLPQVRPTGVMNSLDFMKVKFNRIGFTDKWKDFIGDPSPGFTAMVFGRPKFGKSFLCIDFAGYLARNHGRTLYVAKEEELDTTLQEKLAKTITAHENLDVADLLPDDLTPYKFVFLDSITRLGISLDKLKQLEAAYPDISFIYVFQVRKDGMFRGRNDFQHDVDVVIEVPEHGKAIQYGRFNQGGEMEIFQNAA